MGGRSYLSILILFTAITSAYSFSRSVLLTSKT